MDRLRIYNMALSVFNIEPLDAAAIEDAEGHPEVKVLDIFLGPAERMAMRVFPWPFLEEVLELGDDEGPVMGYQHSYQLPEGLFRLTRADGRYEVVGNKLLTDGRPLAIGINETPPDRGVPEDFWDLVAFALAYYASAKLSAGDSKASFAMDLFNSIAQSMALNAAQDEQRKDLVNGDGWGDHI